MQAKLKVKIKLSALKVLIKEIKIGKLFFIVNELVKNGKKGEPWKNLVAPEDEKESECRELIGDAILLYRALKKISTKESAERIIRKVIEVSAVTQLNFLIPRIERKALEKMSAKERERFFREIVEKFPNTDYKVVDVSDKEYGFDITRCRLVELIVKAGHPELSDAFCSGDGIYFNSCQPEIAFLREKMIGKGDNICDFGFKMKE